MTQTIDQRARSALRKAAQDAGLINFVTMIDEGDLDEFDRVAIAALTEALTRIEELEAEGSARITELERMIQSQGVSDAQRITDLEAALKPFAECYLENWQRDASDEIGIVTHQTLSEDPEFTLADLRRAATLTQGIRE